MSQWTFCHHLTCPENNYSEWPQWQVSRWDHWVYSIATCHFCCHCMHPLRMAGRQHEQSQSELPRSRPRTNSTDTCSPGPVNTTESFTSPKFKNDFPSKRINILLVPICWLGEKKIAILDLDLVTNQVSTNLPWTHLNEKTKLCELLKINQNKETSIFVTC